MATIEQVGIELNSTQAATAAKQFEQAMERAARSTGVLDKELTGTEARLKRSGSTTSILAREMRLATQSILAQSAETAKLTARLAAMEPALIRNASAMERVGASSRRTVASVAQVGASTARSAAGFAALTGPLTRMAALFGGGLGLRAAVTSLSSFEKTLATVGAVAGASGAQMQRLRDRAADLGATTEFTAAEAGEGLLFLARAGFSAEEAIAALPRTLDLATAGALGLGEAADIASNVLSQFRLEVSELARVNDALVTVSNSANTDIRQLAEALNYAGPVAGSLGIQIEEVAASIGVLGDSGIQASLAGTNIRGILAALASSTPDARKALSDLRVDMTRLDPATNSVVDILRELERANLDAATAFDVFGRRNAAAILTLTSGVDKIDELIQKQREAAGATEAQAAAIRDTLAGSINTLKSTLEAAVLATGDDGLTGGLRDIVDGATETVRKLFDLESRTDEFGATTDLAATAVEAFGLALALQGGASFLGFLNRAFIGIGNVSKALFAAGAAQRIFSASLLANPLGLAAAAAVGLGVALRTLARDTDEAELRIQRNKKAVEELTAVFRDFEKAIGDLPVGDAVDAQAQRASKTAEAIRSLSARVSGADIQNEYKTALDLIAVEDRRNALLARRAQLQREIQQLEANLPSLSGDIAGAGLGAFQQAVSDIARANSGLRQVDKALEDIQTTIGAGVRVGGRNFLSVEAIASVRKELEGLGVGLDAFDEAVRRSTQSVGGAFGKELVQVGLLQKALQDLAAEQERSARVIAGTGISDSATPGQLTTFAVKEFQGGRLGDAEKELDLIAQRAVLLQRVADGVLTLEDVEARLADQQAVSAQVESVLNKAKSEGIQITEDAEAKIRDLIQTIVDGDRALNDQAEELRRAAAARVSATDAADTLAQSMQAEIDALNGLSAEGSAVEQVMARINAVFGEGSDEAGRYADQLQKLAKELDEARSRAGGGRGSSPSFSAGAPFALPGGVARTVDDLAGQMRAEIARLRGDLGNARDTRIFGLTENLDRDVTPEQFDRLRELDSDLEQAVNLAIQVENVSDGFADAVGNAVNAFASGAGELEDIAAGLLRDLQAVAVDAFITEPLKQALSEGIGDVLRYLSRSANGNVFDRGGIQAFANGGIVGSPTLFGYGGGRLGLMGEAGPEAILPLERGSGGKLGVRGGQQITYAPRFTVTVAAGADVAGVRDAMKKSSRMMSRDFQRRARGLN